MTEHQPEGDATAEIAAVRARLGRPPEDRVANVAERFGQFVVFRVGASVYAIAAGQVRGVERAPVVTPVPLTPAYVAGVYNLRGTLQPAIDVGLFLGGESGANRYVVNVAVGEDTAGLLVDEVEEVATWPEAAIEPVARPSADSPLIGQYAAMETTAPSNGASDRASDARIVGILDAALLLQAVAADVERLGR